LGELGVTHNVFIGDTRDVRSDVQTGTPRRPRFLTLNPLIRHWFDILPHKYVKIILRCSINCSPQEDEDFAGELFFPHYFISRGWQFALFEKESQNGLESPEDRRSAGWHGNQHVCLRGPQVSKLH
jgi:hypothetical protein